MKRTRFSDVSYERPAIGDVKEQYERLRRDVNAATDSATTTLLTRWLEFDAQWMGAKTLCEIGLARDMGDVRYAKDRRFFDEHDGHVKEWSRRAVEGLLRPPHIEILIREQGRYFVDFLASEIQLLSPGLSDLAVKERSLVTRQEMLCADDRVDGAKLRSELDEPRKV